MPSGFTEKSAIETGFSRIFDERIAPRMEALMSDRDGLRQRTRRDVMILAAIAAVIALILPMLYGLRAVPMGGLPFMAAGFAGYWLVRRRSRQWNRTLIDTFIPDVCEFLGGLHYQRDASDVDLIPAFEKVGIIAPSKRQNQEHYFAGWYRQTGFEVVQARLRRHSGGKSGSSDVDTSLLFRIEVPATIPGTIVIVPKGAKFIEELTDALASSPLRHLEPVTMDKPDFDDRFRVRSDDPDGARRLMAPGFMDALLDIDKTEGGATYQPSLTAAFTGNTFLMTLSRWEQSFGLGPIKFQRQRTFLETRSILRDNPDLEGTIHRMFDDIALAYRIIDRFHDA